MSLNVVVGRASSVLPICSFAIPTRGMLSPAATASTDMSRNFDACVALKVVQEWLRKIDVACGLPCL